MGKLICFILGVIFLAAGAIGLLLPVIPQVPFLALGFVFLMLGSKRFAKWLKSTALYQNQLKGFIKKSRFLSRLIHEEE